MARLHAGTLLLVASCMGQVPEQLDTDASRDTDVERPDDTDVEPPDTDVEVDTEVADTDDTDPPPCGVPLEDDSDDPGCLFALAPPASEGDPLVFTTSGWPPSVPVLWIWKV